MAYFYCATYTSMKANESSSSCDWRSHYNAVYNEWYWWWIGSSRCIGIMQTHM